jgi:hypothetical protein
MNVLLDSVIWIDHLNGVQEATRYLAAVRGESAVSVITRAEVLAGLAAGEVELVRRLLDRFPTLDIDRPTAEEAAALRRAHRWKLPDALQAALARRHGLRLATRNERDFPAERFGFVVVPYRI